MADISISVYRPKGRSFYLCQWVNPATGRKKTKSTGTKIKRDAERFAGQLAKDIQTDDYREDSRMPFIELGDAYIEARAKRKSESHRTSIRKAFRRYDEVVKPKNVNAVTTASIGRFVTHLEDAQLSPATVASYLKSLRVVFRWADKNGLILKCPEFEMPDGANQSGGRPITTEEFERMLQACKTKRKEYAGGWKFLLRGLWESGLRITEAYHLSWDADADIRMEFDGKRPMFWIAAKMNKNRKDQRWPMSKEFYELVTLVPEEQRHGFVFNPTSKNQNSRHNGKRMTRDQVRSTIGKIGKKANIVTKRTEAGKTLYASAHDLRRSFGFRWASKVMPAVLKALMRHGSIETTMKFYVAQGEEQFADTIWLASTSATNTLANTQSGNAGPPCISG